jgi:hypothetical protein
MALDIKKVFEDVLKNKRGIEFTSEERAVVIDTIIEEIKQKVYDADYGEVVPGADLVEINALYDEKRRRIKERQADVKYKLDSLVAEFGKEEAEKTDEYKKAKVAADSLKVQYTKVDEEFEKEVEAYAEKFSEVKEMFDERVKILGDGFKKLDITQKDFLRGLLKAKEDVRKLEDEEKERTQEWWKYKTTSDRFWKGLIAKPIKEALIGEDTTIGKAIGFVKKLRGTHKTQKLEAAQERVKEQKAGLDRASSIADIMEQKEEDGGTTIPTVGTTSTFLPPPPKAIGAPEGKKKYTTIFSNAIGKEIPVSAQSLLSNITNRENINTTNRENVKTTNRENVKTTNRENVKTTNILKPVPVYLIKSEDPKSKVVNPIPVFFAKPGSAPGASTQAQVMEEKSGVLPGASKFLADRETTGEKEQKKTNKLLDLLVKNSLMKKGGGLLAFLGMAIGAIALLGGGLIGFILTGKSEYLGSVMKGIDKTIRAVKGGLSLAKKVFEHLPEMIQKPIQNVIGKVTHMFTAPFEKLMNTKIVQKAVTGTIERLIKPLSTLGKTVVSAIFKPFAGIFAHAAGGVVGKIAGKGLKMLKRIPGLGLLLGIVFGINRFRKGDVVGGLLELGSGLAGLLDLVAPGVGLGIGLAIDAFLLLRDLKGDFGGGAEPKQLGKTGKSKGVLGWAGRLLGFGKKDEAPEQKGEGAVYNSPTLLNNTLVGERGTEILTPVNKMREVFRETVNQINTATTTTTKVPIMQDYTKAMIANSVARMGELKSFLEKDFISKLATAIAYAMKTGKAMPGTAGGSTDVAVSPRGQ